MLDLELFSSFASPQRSRFASFMHRESEKQVSTVACDVAVIFSLSEEDLRLKA